MDLVTVLVMVSYNVSVGGRDLKVVQLGATQTAVPVRGMLRKCTENSKHELETCGTC